MDDLVTRFRRYVSGLTDEQALVLHRVASQRAAAIYAPMYAQKRDANSQTGRSILGPRS